ncbi:ABC transporter ATP-binding protein [Candidatus Methylopumilus rimovensis]|uniref:ABC transporter ATP-binding protein n=2 Tax=Candidatus Methylopumilus rimovensis TaxID=2588535 RepID=A0AAE6KPR5_9PROT|nr:ABC transporter ATP-binding protein [Candidatus Methylopumilus rimovensis]
MQSITPIGRLLFRLWQHMSLRRRNQFILLLALMVIASFAEIISIGSVIPFLSALTSPETFFINPLAQPLISFLRIENANQLIVPLTIVFCLSAILSGGIRLVLLMFTTRLSFATGSDFGVDIYQRTLYQPYKVHVSRNSSEIINGISNKAHAIIYSVILPALTIVSSSIMLSAILITLIYIDPIISLFTTVIFGSIYILLTKYTRNNKIKNSRVISEQSTQIIKSLQEGLGGIRDVLIDGSQHVYCEIFKLANTPLRQAQANNQVVSQSPRFIMESLGMVLIACLAYYLFNRSDGVSKAIPMLGVLALGAQKILPIMQQSYQAWSSIQGSYASLEDTLLLINQPLPSNSFNKKKLTINFSRDIKFDKVSFHYNSDFQNVIKHLSLSIHKGDRVGIVGATGSGKSTLIDILMGLLEPTSGALKIDGKAITKKNVSEWQRRIAHVPQAIFLSDTTIAENIAFGVDKKNIDFDRVRDAANKAQLQDVIDKLPNQYNTLVGERGVRLSGGQRQRIGIARALYKSADVFIFDEATSALDNKTEDSVIKSIERLGNNITVIMVAHRLTTLKKCKKIIEIANGAIINIGSYQDIFNSSNKTHLIKKL